MAVRKVVATSGDATTSVEEGEVWKPIPGHEGYEVSDLGRVRSVDREVFGTTRWGGHGWRTYRGRILKPQSRDRHGYLAVRLGKRCNSLAVHIVVMEAFRGPVPVGKVVAHFDGDHTNNALANLRYATRQENEADKARHERVSRGEGRPAAKLTRQDVREIRRSPRSLAALAAHYGVHVSTIHRAKTARNWRWLDGDD